MATEKRLIDANELVDTIYRSDEALHSTQWETDEIVDQIDRIPTVDAVEVVFCDDCVKHGGCYTEDVFRLARIEKPYCCVGKMDGDGNG